MLEITKKVIATEIVHGETISNDQVLSLTKLLNSALGFLTVSSVYFDVGISVLE